ncbi:MAG: RnfH family protein [Alphaproteobacteria bacterium]|nr:RnfH family protein [Alphaproteobacteria bacterium]
MKIGVAYATAQRSVWLDVEIDEGATVRQAIEKSGVLTQFPDIDLGQQKVGTFGKLIELDSPAEDGSRIEIYRPIVCDPKTVRRKRPEGGAHE